MKISEYEKRAKVLFDRCIGSLNYPAWQAGIELLNKEFDADRTPVADAAQFLFTVKGFAAFWLRGVTEDEIMFNAKANGEAAHKMGLPVGPTVAFATRAFPVGKLINLGWLTSETIFPVRVESPDRLATADAAQFLAMEVGVGSYWLKTVSAAHIREDAKAFEPLVKSRQVKLKVIVDSLGETDGGYIDLKFFNGDIKVGETHVSGKTTGPYERVVTLSGPYTRYRIESDANARFRIEKVAK